MGGSDETADAAIMAVTSAINEALAAVRAIADSPTAFQLATGLWFELRTAMDRNGQLRAVLAAQTAEEHPELNLHEIARLLSTSVHVVKKARVAELIAAGRKLLQESPSVVSG